jgi:hypothetical protein
VPARSSCRTRKLTASLRRDFEPCVLAFAQSDGCRYEIFNKGSQHPNGGSKAIPVDILTASGARARPRTLPVISNHVCRTGAGNPAAGARADRVKACEPDVAAGGGVRLHRSRDRPDGRAPHVEEGQEAGLAAAALPARSAQEEGHHPPPAGARLLLRLRAWWLSQRRSDGLLQTGSVRVKRGEVSSAARATIRTPNTVVRGVCQCSSSSD